MLQVLVLHTQGCVASAKTVFLQEQKLQASTLLAVISAHMAPNIVLNHTLDCSSPAAGGQC